MTTWSLEPIKILKCCNWLNKVRFLRLEKILGCFRSIFLFISHLHCYVLSYQFANTPGSYTCPYFDTASTRVWPWPSWKKWALAWHVYAKLTWQYNWMPPSSPQKSIAVLHHRYIHKAWVCCIITKRLKISHKVSKVAAMVSQCNDVIRGSK